MSMQHDDTACGASVYSPAVLKIYDWWVLGVSNRLAWRCPTRSVLLPFYRDHVGERHLDAGVGTGFYPAHVPHHQAQELALLDVNKNSLRAAAARLKRPDVRLFTRDVLQPQRRPDKTGYDSVSLFYLLHCLPGSMPEKEPAIATLKQYLASDGVLFGATILGESVEHNAFGRMLMRAYNRRGVFSNQKDSFVGLRRILERHFQTVEIRLHETVALFVARGVR